MRSNVHPVHASGTRLSGFLEGDLAPDGMPDLTRPHRAVLDLPVDGIRSGNRIQDREMERRMDARRFPSIGCVVTGLEPRGAAGNYSARAELTVRGRSRKVVADVRITRQGESVVIDAQQTFDMRDFGIDPPRVLVLKMEPEVRVSAHIVASPVAPA